MSGEAISAMPRNAAFITGIRTDSGNNKPPPETARAKALEEKHGSVSAVFTPSEVIKKSFAASECRFSVDDDLGKLVVEIVNSESGELIRQIPSEEALNLAKRILEANKLG